MEKLPVTIINVNVRTFNTYRLMEPMTLNVSVSILLNNMIEIQEFVKIKNVKNVLGLQVLGLAHVDKNMISI